MGNSLVNHEFANKRQTATRVSSPFLVQAHSLLLSKLLCHLLEMWPQIVLLFPDIVM